MSHLFFDHLVIREELEFELNSYILDPQDRQELVDIIDSTLTHHVLNVILNHLPRDKHPEFMAKFRDHPDDESHLEYLKTHAHPEIEAKIKTQAVKIKQEILAEIRKSRISKRKKS
jgi:hypothetical protein